MDFFFMLYRKEKRKKCIQSCAKAKFQDMDWILCYLRVKSMLDKNMTAFSDSPMHGVVGRLECPAEECIAPVQGGDQIHIVPAQSGRRCKVWRVSQGRLGWKGIIVRIFCRFQLKLSNRAWTMTHSVRFFR